MGLQTQAIDSGGLLYNDEPITPPYPEYQTELLSNLSAV